MTPGGASCAPPLPTARSDHGDALLEGDPELRRVGVALVARNEEVLRTRRVERLDEPHFLAAHGETMRDVVRKRRVGAGLHLELLVTHVRGDRAFDDIDGLVLTRMGVDGRLVAGAHAAFHDSPILARLLADQLELDARAVAVAHRTPGAGAGQDRVFEWHAIAFLLRVNGVQET